MRLSAILEPLVAAGVDAKTILAAVKAYEEQNEDAIERRRANDRERQNRRRHVTSRDVTVTERDIPPSDKEKSPTPPKEINSPQSLRSETKRGARLPTDWALPKQWGEWAISEGHSEQSIRIQADKFRDFWCSKAGKDAAKLDWQATWRNWMRNVPKVARNFGTPAPKPKSDFMQHQDDVQRELDKALGRKRDDEFTGNTLDLEAGNWRAH